MGLWTSLKNFGNGIKRGIKQAGKWAWDHREGIGKVIGAGLDVASTLGVPGAGLASKVVKNVSNIGKQFGEDKFSKGLESTLKKNKLKNDSQQPSQHEARAGGGALSGQSYGGYSLNTRSPTGGTRGSGGTRESILYSWKR